MTTSVFPGALDPFSNPAPSTPQTLHAEMHTEENDSIVALQTKVGTTGSVDATSLDYKVTRSVRTTNNGTDFANLDTVRVNLGAVPVLSGLVADNGNGNSGNAALANSKLATWAAAGVRDFVIPQSTNGNAYGFETPLIVPAQMKAWGQGHVGFKNTPNPATTAPGGWYGTVLVPSTAWAEPNPTRTTGGFDYVRDTVTCSLVTPVIADTSIAASDNFRRCAGYGMGGNRAATRFVGSKSLVRSITAATVLTGTVTTTVTGTEWTVGQYVAAYGFTGSWASANGIWPIASVGSGAITFVPTTAPSGSYTGGASAQHNGIQPGVGFVLCNSTKVAVNPNFVTTIVTIGGAQPLGGVLVTSFGGGAANLTVSATNAYGTYAHVALNAQGQGQSLHDLVILDGLTSSLYGRAGTTSDSTQDVNARYLGINNRQCNKYQGGSPIATILLENVVGGGGAITSAGNRLLTGIATSLDYRLNGSTGTDSIAIRGAALFGSGIKPGTYVECGGVNATGPGSLLLSQSVASTGFTGLDLVIVQQDRIATAAMWGGADARMNAILVAGGTWMQYGADMELSTGQLFGAAGQGIYLPTIGYVGSSDVVSSQGEMLHLTGTTLGPGSQTIAGSSVKTGPYGWVRADDSTSVHVTGGGWETANIGASGTLNPAVSNVTQGSISSGATFTVTNPAVWFVGAGVSDKTAPTAISFNIVVSSIVGSVVTLTNGVTTMGSSDVLICGFQGPALVDNSGGTAVIAMDTAFPVNGNPEGPVNSVGLPSLRATVGGAAPSPQETYNVTIEAGAFAPGAPLFPDGNPSYANVDYAGTRVIVGGSSGAGLSTTSLQSFLGPIALDTGGAPLTASLGASGQVGSVRSDTTGVTVTAGSSAVADTSAIAGDLGKLVAAVGGSGSATIPVNTYVGSVSAGVSFTLSSVSPSAANFPQAVNAGGTGTYSAVNLTPSISIIGNQQAGYITVVTGTGTLTAGTLATLAYAATLASVPKAVMVAPGNNGAAVAKPYCTGGTTTQFPILASTAPVGSTTYLIAYHVDL